MSTKRTYILGDEWLYYKIYCGARTSDVLLTETIKPLTDYLLKEKLIDSWFFIRYGDPDFHIRIRFHLQDVKNTGNVILRINTAMQEYVKQHIVYKVQVDTYIRELERYGNNTIEISEELFFYDSVMLLDAIDTIEDEELYFLFVVKAIDQLLKAFNYKEQEKLDFVIQNAQAFKKEFHANKGLNKQLDKKYRGLKNKLSLFLEATYSPEDDYVVLDRLLNYKIEKSLSGIQRILDAQKNHDLEMPLDSLIASYIHMLVNRAFRSKQRFYELVCYDFLVRYQKEKINYNVQK